MFLRNTDKCGLCKSQILAVCGSEGLWIDPRVEDHPFDGWATYFPFRVWVSGSVYLSIVSFISISQSVGLRVCG